MGNRNRDSPHVEAVVATFLYTGGRSAEVLGLVVEDADFAAKKVHFRPNEYRKLKRARHRRAVDLWPPLALTQKQLARACARADALAAQRSLSLARPLAGRISPHSLRHTFATMLLHTTVATESGGRAMRSAFSVGRALGHKNETLVQTTYGHLLSDALMTDSLSYEAWRQMPASRLVDPTAQAAPSVKEPQRSYG